MVSLPLRKWILLIAGVLILAAGIFVYKREATGRPASPDRAAALCTTDACEG